MKKTITIITNGEVIDTWKGSIIPRKDESLEVGGQEYLVYKVTHTYDEVIINVAEN